TQLKSLHRELRHTMIYVTHDQTEALTFADKVVVMYDGRVVQMGTPEELFETPQHTFVGYFIGSPGMNLLEASVEGSHAMVNGVEVPLGAAYGPINGRTQIGIRPEFAALTDGAGLPFALHRIEDVGRHRILRGEVFGLPFNIVAPEGVGISPDMTRVSFAPQKVNVYADDWRVAPSSKAGKAL
ncbi:MAG: ABC transporter ATP-binding protein, partial [Paracoccaceae bacterium]|nr:ABC transporter ATP-binding protein [Paracoccaceae bacterium]